MTHFPVLRYAISMTAGYAAGKCSGLDAGFLPVILLMTGAINLYTYSILQWLIFFYIYCFIGWVFESSWVSFLSRRFVNRGFLRAPLLPLYGTGAIMMLWVSIPFQGNLLMTFIAGTVGATILEYIVGVGMEALFKVKYWDYSKQRFNFQGVICLSSSIAWGFLTLLLTQVIHRPIEELVFRMPQPALWIVDIAVSIVFIADTVISVHAALDIRKMLDTMTEIRAELDKIQVQLSLFKMETRDQLNGLKDKTLEQMDAFKAYTKEQLEALKEASPVNFSLLETLKEKSAEYESVREHFNFFKKALLRGNPNASSRKFNDALKDLKAYLDESKKIKK